MLKYCNLDEAVYHNSYVCGYLTYLTFSANVFFEITSDDVSRLFLLPIPSLSSRQILFTETPRDSLVLIEFDRVVGVGWWTVFYTPIG